jgi:hypothetical protein
MTQRRSTFRFSFASMLIGTAVLSLVVYATVYPSVWAASLAFTAAVVILSLGLARGLGNTHLRRRYWLAFSLLGFAYLATLYVPVLDEHIGPRLATTVGFAGVESLLYTESRDRADDPLRPVMIQRAWARNYVEGNPYPVYRTNSQNSAPLMLPQETWAAQTFHSVVAVLWGMVAGWVTCLPVSRHTSKTPEVAATKSDVVE